MSEPGVRLVTRLSTVRDLVTEQLALRGFTAKHESKSRGAYYTDPEVARFLVRWGVRFGEERVLDPGFGGGVFLAAAGERLRTLGGNPATQLFGVEFDDEAFRSVAEENSPGAARLLHRNFFDLTASDLPQVDAVVGNPPFIRYQRFGGDTRRQALCRASEAGVTLSGLASSWAPFLVHAVRFIRDGGRLAMVAPAELGYAVYARPVIDFLRRTFRSIWIVSFASKLFPRLSEEAVLVLAADKGCPFEGLEVIDLPTTSALDEWGIPETPPQGVKVDPVTIIQGEAKLANYVLRPQTHGLYQELLADVRVLKLGDIADVGIGYVTGDNDFFHLDRETVERFHLPDDVLRPAVRRGADFCGIRLTAVDWTQLYGSGRACRLLFLPPDKPVPDSVQRYLEHGARRGVPNRYKCRVREAWYSVPLVYDADGFLTYMSGSDPKLVVNEAGAVAPNTLHIVRLLPGVLSGAERALQLAVAWQSSLTGLSCEMEGHSLGGGLLKLEPKEARRVAVACPDLQPEQVRALAEQLDALVRTGRRDEARELVDKELLHEALGLSWADMHRLREGWLALKSRRLGR